MSQQDPPDSRSVRPGHIVSYSGDLKPITEIVDNDTDPIVLLNRMVCLGIKVELWSPQPNRHLCHLVGVGRFEAGSLVGVIRKAWETVEPQTRKTL